MTVKERPILFSAPMVQAILSGRKTVTRRIVKQLGDDQGREFIYRRGKVWCSMTPEEVSPLDATQSIYGGEALFDGVQSYTPVVVGQGPKGEGNPLRCPYGKPGECLWVRESFAIESFGAGVAQIRYKADGKRGNNAGVSDRKLPNRYGGVPSIHMPRHCSRITLEVTDVRVERLQDITEEDAIKEGFQSHYSPAYVSYGEICGPDGVDARDEFRELWEKLNGPGSWSANPWIWRVEFKRLDEQDSRL